MLLQQGVYLPEDHLVLIFAEWHNTAFIDAQPTVWNDFLEVYLIDNSQAFTMWTNSLWRVE